MFAKFLQGVDFAAVFSHAPIAMYVSQDDTILACNGAANALFVATGKTLIGKLTASLHPSAEESTHFKSEMTEAIEIKQSYLGDRVMKRSTGELFWCRITAVPMSTTGRHLKLIWTFTEVRMQRRVYQTLSPREREVAGLLVAGNTSKMIAVKVGLSPRTVEFYRRSLMQKFSATSFSDLLCQLMSDLTGTISMSTETV